METTLFYTILFICLTIAYRFRKQIWHFSDFCYQKIREFGIRKGLKKLVISSKIRIFIGENQ